MRWLRRFRMEHGRFGGGRKSRGDLPGGELFGAPFAEFFDDGDGTYSWTFSYPVQTVAGMYLVEEFTQDNFASILLTASHQLTAPEIAGTPFDITTGDLADGDYDVRWYIKNAANTSRITDYSTTVTATLVSTPITAVYHYLFY
jgi:hypothetical protein